jgi:hypothetical protein
MRSIPISSWNFASQGDATPLEKQLGLMLVRYIIWFLNGLRAAGAAAAAAEVPRLGLATPFKGGTVQDVALKVGANNFFFAA